MSKIKAIDTWMYHNEEMIKINNISDDICPKCKGQVIVDKDTQIHYCLSCGYIVKDGE